MNDKEILNEVYEKLKAAAAMPSTQDAGSIRSFIESEWQKEDKELDEELHDEMCRDEYNDPDHPLNKHDEGQMYNIQIVNNEIENVVPIPSKTECHRGLEISPDGTVTKLI